MSKKDKKQITRAEQIAAMKAGVIALLDEVCAADGYDTRAREAGKRALDKALSRILSAGADGVRWEAFDGMSAEEVSAATRAEMRDDVLAALAPLRPS